MAWGSFLNVVSCRLINGQSIITPGSYCPHCSHALAWYDLVPVLSYCILGGRCRYCKKSVSWLYPFIELLTLGIMLALFYFVPTHFLISYFIFFSALLVTIRTDLQFMLISRFVTIFLIPVGFLLSWLELLPILPASSLLGSVFGYCVLWGTARSFRWLTGKDGMGQGDLELLAFIGAFIGTWGCWITLMLASCMGSVIGITYLLITRQKKSIKIPFGPFLALGAIIFVLHQEALLLIWKNL